MGGKRTLGARLSNRLVDFVSSVFSDQSITLPNLERRFSDHSADNDDSFVVRLRVDPIALYDMTFGIEAVDPIVCHNAPPN